MERLQPQSDGGQGELVLGDTRGPAPNDLVLLRAAERGLWSISPALRAKAIAKCEDILDTPGDKRHLGAVKAIILADSLNVRREATASTEQIALLSTAADRLRSALSDPKTRQALAALSQPQHDTPTSPAEPTPTPTP